MDTEMLANLSAHYPPRFITHPELTEIGTLNADDAGVLAAACAEPVRELVRRSGHDMQLCTGMLSDGSGELSVTWSYTPYLHETLQPGRRIILFGEIQPSGNRLHLQ